MNKSLCYYLLFRLNTDNVFNLAQFSINIWKEIWCNQIGIFLFAYLTSMTSVDMTKHRIDCWLMQFLYYSLLTQNKKKIYKILQYKINDYLILPRSALNSPFFCDLICMKYSSMLQKLKNYIFKDKRFNWKIKNKINA